MQLVRLHQCLCDATRVRVVHLLINGPLCVCHIQRILGQTQVNVSRHLAYLKERGVVEALKHRNWKIYSLPAKRSASLAAALNALKASAVDEPLLRADLISLRKALAADGVSETLREACQPARKKLPSPCCPKKKVKPSAPKPLNRKRNQ